MHTTNYFNTFIEVAEDCPAAAGVLPPLKGDARTVANIHFDMIAHNPYRYTSDDVVFEAFAVKNGIGKQEKDAARDSFFAKGQPCLRCSPLGKRYGWGIHCDAEGKVALYAADSPDYKKMKGDAALKHVKAMRSKKG